MKSQTALSSIASRLLTLLLLSVGVISSAWSSDYRVIYKFKGGTDGLWPFAGLVLGAEDALYGTAELGGTANGGVVFKLSPNRNGSWTQSVLYNFKGGSDGLYPDAELVFDAVGNLYGTTNAGGGQASYGTVFKLIPNPDGSWTESVIYRFKGAPDAAYPNAGLIFDSAGSLYGATSGGGTGKCHLQGGCGTVFQLAPNDGGTWTENVLHSFTGADGADPRATPILDALGNFYGTTFEGGAWHCYVRFGCGTVFKLSLSPDGSWTHEVIASFGGHPAASPFGGVIFDSAGNLYGTTSGYDAHNSLGTVFKLTTQPDGSWKRYTLHAFTNTEGYFPLAGVILDPVGNLLGLTTGGGEFDSGTVFRLAPSSTDDWTFTNLHSFKNDANPSERLVMDSSGHVYGTAPYGGAGAGIVFQVTP